MYIYIYVCDMHCKQTCKPHIYYKNRILQSANAAVTPALDMATSYMITVDVPIK